MAFRDIVILANSRRHGAHCIAGKDLTTKEWVRPITIFGEGRGDPEAFSDSDLQTLTGDLSGPKVLDCVRIGFGPKCGKNCQPENIFVDGKVWEKISSYPRDQLSKIVDIPGNCFLGKDDPYNDRIPVDEVKSNPLISSLNLIKLNQEKNYVTLDHTQKSDGTFKHKMSFTYDTKSYRIWHENTIQGRGERIPILLPDPALLTQRQLHVKSSGSLPKLPMLEFSPLQTLRGHLFSHPYDQRIHHT